MTKPAEIWTTEHLEEFALSEAAQYLDLLRQQFRKSRGCRLLQCKSPVLAIRTRPFFAHRPDRRHNAFIGWRRPETAKMKVSLVEGDFQAASFLP